MSFLLFWPANHLNSVLPLISLDCVSSLSVSSLNVSSLCVRRCGLLKMLLLSGMKVQRDSSYRLLPRTGPPWIRLGCTGPPWFSWDGIQKRYEEACWSTCAGLQLSSRTSYRRAEKPKMVSTSSSSTICGLWPRIRGWSMVFTEVGLSFIFAGGGVGTRRGTRGCLAQAGLRGVGGPHWSFQSPGSEKRAKGADSPHTANPVWFINSRKSFSIGSIPISNYMFLNRIINFRCELWTGSCGGQARKAPTLPPPPPPIQLLQWYNSSLFLCGSCQLRKCSISTTLYPPPSQCTQSWIVS